jgi:hypothetical protein
MKYIHTTDVSPQALVARNYPPHTHFTTFCLHIYFHLFFLILTCTCPYSYNLVLTATLVCRPNITLIVNRVDEVVKKLY